MRWLSPRLQGVGKRPVIVAIAIGFVFIYAVVDHFHERQVYRDRFRDVFLLQERNLVGYSKLATELGKQGLWDDVADRLEDATQHGFISFYLLQYKGHPISFFPPERRAEFESFAYEPSDQRYEREFETFFTTRIDANHVLTMGLEKRVENYVDRSMALSSDKKIMIESVIYALAILIVVVMWNMRDILAMLRRLRKGGTHDLTGIKVNSLESEIFYRGLMGYAQTVTNLSVQNKTLGNQVLPSLKKEILSGKKPPYDFKCTMVRTDINNFSGIYNKYDVTQFMNIINEFFAEVSHVVSRYNGLIHEFLGDEVIFYFKDDDHANSRVIALSAIRDINVLANAVHERTRREFGYPFTVKSSFAHGVIRFGPLVNGYSLAGAVLIETVRILSHVTEKDDNAVYFDQSQQSFIYPQCRSEEVARVKMKGYEGERTLYAYRGHRSLNELLENLDESMVPQLAFYRNDEDLIKILNHLRAHSDQLPETLLLKAIQTLRDARVTKSDARLSQTLLAWVEEMAHQQRENPDAPDAKRWKLLSAAVMLVMNLVPKTGYDQEFESRLSKLLELRDRRVVANVLDVMTHFKAAGEPSFLQKVANQLAIHDDNRVAGNALVHEGTRDLNLKVIKRIRKMLASGKPGHIASALYAVGEIAAYHRQTDLVFYSTQIDFIKLVQGLPGLAIHADPMVRRQSMIAARKSGDERVIEMIQAYRESHPQLSEEIDAYLGSRVVARLSVA